MLVYAALKCESIHESGFEVISLHFSKADAYKACRAWWLLCWAEWNDESWDSGAH